MGIIDLLQRRPPNLVADQHIQPYQDEDLIGAQTVLAAAQRVSERFGAKTNRGLFQSALTTVDERNAYAAIFQTHGVRVLDTGKVLRYQAERLVPSLLERFKSWSEKVTHTSNVVFDTGKGLLALISLFVTIPALVCFSIDTFWYEIDFFWSWIVIIFAQGAVLSLSDDVSDDGIDQLWALVTMFLAGLPIMILTIICGFWFHHAGSNRTWISTPVATYDAVLPDAVTLSIDQILQAAPDARIELEILEPRVGATDEMFVTVLIGDIGERLYLWHEFAR